MMSEPTLEEVIDRLYEITNDLPPALALDALIATIIGTTHRCADFHRALLAVLYTLTGLVRFVEAEHDTPGIDPKKVMSGTAWAGDAWDDYPEDDQ